MSDKETKPQVFISFFCFRKNKFWAFKQMLLGPVALSKQSNLTFFKFLGTGGGAGFSLRPDFGTYAILTVWRSPIAFDRFQKENTYWQSYLSKASKVRTLGLIPVHSHGLWSGVNPFEPFQVPTYPITEERVAVLTRATLHWNRLISFWRAVPKAAKTIETAKGVLFYKGVGEWPWIQQATVSIWESFQAVNQFAYQHKGHAEIVRKTRQQKWYKEDLFSRFVVYSDTEFQELN